MEIVELGSLVSGNRFLFVRRADEEMMVVEGCENECDPPDEVYYVSLKSGLIESSDPAARVFRIL